MKIITKTVVAVAINSAYQQLFVPDFPKEGFVGSIDLESISVTSTVLLRFD